MLPLQGRKIALRDWTIADLEPYASWLAPHHQWQRLDAPYYHSDADDIPQIIESSRARIAAADWSTPRVRLVIAQDDQLIGTVSRYWISEETNWSAVGIVIYDPALWGQGLGYEALGLWSDYLFRAALHWVRLDLRTWSGNRGMMRLALKLGYQQEACFRMARIVEGQYYDGMGYGVLRDEWERRYPGGFAAHLGSACQAPRAVR